jgi:hypothetical protein
MNVVIESAEMTVQEENKAVITWEGNNGFGHITNTHTGSGQYLIDSELLSHTTIKKIFEKL